MLERPKEMVLTSKDVNFPLQEIQMTVEDEVIKNLTVKLTNNLNALESFLHGKPGKSYSYSFEEPKDIDVIAKVLLGMMSTRKAYNGIKDGEYGYTRCGSDASAYPSIQILIALGLEKKPVKYVKDSFCQEIKSRLGKGSKQQKLNNDFYEEILEKKSQIIERHALIADALPAEEVSQKALTFSLITSPQAFFSHAPASPDMVRLKNGTEVYARAVTGIMMNLECLKEDMAAFKDFVNKCRNPDYIMVTSTAKEFGLIENDVVHNVTRNVVLSAVQGEGEDMTLESPIAEAGLSFRL